MEKELIDYYKKKCFNYRILTLQEKMHIKLLIENIYINQNKRYGFSLFDVLKIEESVSVNCFSSWSWICDFIKDKNIIVFFDYKEGEYIELSNGSIFVEFYEDSPKEEFYIIDLHGTFLLGYNHSNCLFAMGTAADWLEQSEKYMDFYKNKNIE